MPKNGYTKETHSPKGVKTINCPFSGLPCAYTKAIQVKVLSKQGTVADAWACLACVGNILQLNTTTYVGMPFTAATPPSSLIVPSCSKCNTSLHDIFQMGKLGCPECYSSFHDNLIPLLEMHHQGRTSHKGKIPQYRLFHNTLEDLREKLAKAVKDEKYEDAIILRNRIKEVGQYPPVQNPTGLDT